ncbi:MAG: heme exporter protein CcmD [Rhodobacterales bacterium]|nr:heme exporter protein CcmD [Rhodobacterales bacterium]
MSDFFSMGGYAAFIWPCFGVTAVVLVALLVISQRRLSASRRLLDSLEAAEGPRRPRRAQSAKNGETAGEAQA